MIVWCEICKMVPLDTACNERLVCMPCGVGEAFDSYQLYREYNDRLDAPKPWLIAFEQPDGTLQTVEVDTVRYDGSTVTWEGTGTLFPTYPYYEWFAPENIEARASERWYSDHIIRSVN